MNKELVISVSEAETQIALLEDKQLVELHKERNNNHYTVGDLFVGKSAKSCPD